MPVFVNKKNISSFVFSGGECHVRLSPADIGDKTHILAHLNNSDDILTLLLTVDAIRRINAKSEIELTIPYFPYARQDRVCNEGEALSVKVMAGLINCLNCNQITIYDPHSDVTPALLNNCKIIGLSDIIESSLLADFIRINKLTLISPDAGAEKKINATAKKLSSNQVAVNVLSATKTRDTLTGNITSTHIHGDVAGKNLIMLDDICDGGRTFIELAKNLKAAGACDIYLYVTHGIFSQGLEILRTQFKHVYCYHTMFSEDKISNDFLTVLNQL